LFFFLDRDQNWSCRRNSQVSGCNPNAVSGWQSQFLQRYLDLAKNKHTMPKAIGLLNTNIKHNPLTKNNKKGIELKIIVV